jgi:hypothetical protein
MNYVPGNDKRNDNLGWKKIHPDAYTYSTHLKSTWDGRNDNLGWKK